MAKKKTEDQTIQQAPESSNLVMIPIEQLHPHPDNPRKDLGDLTELADSIKPHRFSGRPHRNSTPKS